MWIKSEKQMISIKYLLILLFFFSAHASHAQENFSNLYGIWHWDKTNIDVDVNVCSYNPEKMCAIIVKGDRKGSYVLRTITKKDNKFIGKMIHPINGRSYQAEIKLINKTTVEISGCAGSNIDCQVSTWHRVSSPKP